MGRMHVRVSNNATEASTLQQKTIKRINELATQFNSPLVHPKKFKLNINGKIIVADAESSLGAPVFKDLTDIEVLGYFKELAGLENLPPAKTILGKSAQK